jgi:hypothetical protein
VRVRRVPAWKEKEREEMHALDEGGRAAPSGRFEREGAALSGRAEREDE